MRLNGWIEEGENLEHQVLDDFTAVLDPGRIPPDEFLNLIAGVLIVQTNAVAEAGDLERAEQLFSKRSLGTGPFKLERFVPHDRVVLVKNQEWRHYEVRERMHDKVTYSMIANRAEMIAGVIGKKLSGAIFSGGIEPKFVPLVRSTEGVSRTTGLEFWQADFRKWPADLSVPPRFLPDLPNDPIWDVESARQLISPDRGWFLAQ